MDKEKPLEITFQGYDFPIRVKEYDMFNKQVTLQFVDNKGVFDKIMDKRHVDIEYLTS